MTFTEDSLASWEPAILMVDSSGKILEVTRAFAIISGWTKEELLGRNLGSPGPDSGDVLFSSDDLQEVLDGTPRLMKISFFGKNHEVITTGLSVLPIKGDGGEVSAVVLLFGDPIPCGAGALPVLASTGPMADAEHCLYRVFFEENITGHFIADPDGRIIDCNQAFLTMFGIPSKGRAIGTSIGEFFLEPSNLGSFLRHVSRNRRIGPRDSRWKKTDGSIVDVLESLMVVTGEKGSPVFFLGFLVDTTEKKQLEMEFYQAQKMESIGRLAGGIAHDFNNILQAMMAAAESLIPCATSSPEIEIGLGEIRNSIQRASRLTRRLLTFSRHQILEFERIEINRFIEPLLKMLRRLVGEDISLDFEISREDLYVDADSGQIEQILLNLVVNARDATPSGGRITIRCYPWTVDEKFRNGRSWARMDSYVVLEVSDSGEGIPEEIQDKIFEPFFTTKELGKGTGLGLATVFGIVSQHNGAIEVDSEPGRGSTFSVFLPRVETPRTTAPLSVEDQFPQGGVGAVILFAEDDSDVRNVVSRALRKAGFEVLKARDGREALALFEEHVEEISAVILDVVMPGLSGIEVAGKILDHVPDIPLFFSTGYSDSRIDDDMMTRENVRVLNKPYSFMDLFRNLQEALREKGHPVSD